MITKSERTELRPVVKQQFKVLRAEIKQREAELRAEANNELNKDSGHHDQQWSDVSFLANEAVMEANRKVVDILRQQGLLDKGHTEPVLVGLSWQFGDYRKKTDHSSAVKQIDLDVKERVRRAELAIERQEADLLRTLAVDALESEDAHNFLKAIPTAAELVPTARLQELLGSVEQGVINKGKK